MVIAEADGVEIKVSKDALAETLAGLKSALEIMTTWSGRNPVLFVILLVFLLGIFLIYRLTRLDRAKHRAQYQRARDMPGQRTALSGASLPQPEEPPAVHNRNT